MHTMDYDLQSIQSARDLARKGAIAAKQLANYSSEQIDRIIHRMMEVGEENAQRLAQLAVEETGFGRVQDKLYKNHMASGLLYEQIKDKQTIGVIGVDEAKQKISIAEPIGLLLGIVPSTNPTSTVFYKCMIAMKSRNTMVFSPHPSAKKCTLEAIALMNQAAVEAGAPENVFQGLEAGTMEATNELMHCKEVQLIIATGGPGMVKAAYSAGKPALGVGPGNSPAYIERTANVQQAVRNIMTSKTFDNGTICASEQSVICETVNRQEVVREFEQQGGYFLSEEETKKVCNLLFRPGTIAMAAKFVGRDALTIAKAAGISVPPTTRVLLGEQKGVGKEWPLSFEKLTCVLGFYCVSDWEEACELSIELLQNGIGHTMSLHTEDKDIVRKYSVKPASRILINTGSTMGGTGISTGLDIALTLGCGTWGGSSISENVGPEHLINVKHVVYGIKDVTRLLEEDEIFQKYHGNQAHSRQGYQAPAKEQALPEDVWNPYESNKEKSAGCCGIDKKPSYPNSGLEYKAGCGCGDGKYTNMPRVSEEIDLQALQQMVNDMVLALQGQ